MSRNDAIFYMGVAAVVVIAAVLFFVFHPNSPRFTKAEYSILSTEIHTLAKGSDVTVNGLTNGTVLGFQQEGEYIKIKAVIDERILIPKDSKVYIRNNGLLGERVLAVILGRSPETYEPGSTIYASSDKGTSGLVRQAKVLIKESQEIIASLAVVLDSVVFSDASKESLERIKQSGKRLITKSSGAASKSTQSIVATIDVIQVSIRQIEECIHQFDSETVGENIEQIVANGTVLIQKLDQLSELVEQEKLKTLAGENSLGKALYGPQFQENLESIKKSAFKLKDVILAQELTINVDF
jgi:ABC-type transporter Mla subunit MlaD